MTSNINPNNINGNYPVAGQDNNSQGFRDNFTNTQTNFQYAAEEISDLQSKVVLKAALTGTTLNNDMQGSILSNAQLQYMSNTVVALGTLSGSVTVNYAAGPYQTVTTGGSISLAFTNWTPSGTQDYVIVQVTVTNTAYTLTLPAAVGSGASATSLNGIQGLNTGTNTITFGATGTYVYSFVTTDGGSTIYLNDLTQGRSNFSGNVSLGNLAITANTAATSTSTGALTVAGGVGIAGNLYVAGNIVGNIAIDNIESIIGNVTAGNVLTGGIVSAVGNVRGGNINTVGMISATANIVGGNVTTVGLVSATGNATAGNILTAGIVSATANVTGGNILTAGIVSSTGNATHGNILTGGIVSATGNISGGNVAVNGIVSAGGNVVAGNLITSGSLNRYLDVETANFANITANAQSVSLSTASSINVLIANNTGYTATLNMPSTPVDGQICNFAVHGNTVTLVAGTGTVLPTFAGSATVGTGFRYIYRTSNTSWYKIG